MTSPTTISSESTTDLSLAKYIVFGISACTVLVMCAGLFIQYDPRYIWYVVTFLGCWTSGTLIAAWQTASETKSQANTGQAILIYGTVLFPVILGIFNFDSLQHDLARGFFGGILMLAAGAILFAGVGLALSFVLSFWFEEYREQGAAKTIWQSIVILWATVLVLSLVLGTIEMIKRLGNGR
jgi:hypothetical protein